jgi:hypothetical protein
MSMKLKRDENNAPVFQDDKPVYVDSDGRDFVADVPSMYSRISEYKGEAKNHREKAESYAKQLGTYSAMFPDMDTDKITEWKLAADKALELAKNIDDKKLIDAGKAEQVKRELQEAHTNNLTKVKEQFSAESKKLNDAIAAKNARIYDLVIGNAFANSPFFSGPKPITLLPPDVGLAYFGKHFKVSETDKGELQVIGMYNGSEILSREPDRVGEIASINEALQVIIDRYPMKERILAAGKAGSGASGGSGNSSAPKDEIEKLEAQLVEANKNGRADLSIALTNRIHNLKRTSSNK